MTDSDKLRELIKNSRYRLEYYASNLDISIASLHKKINNDTEFKPSEIFKLAKLLGMTSRKQIWEIFFAHDVERKSTNGGE
jgi:hypothetical protein